MTRRCRRYANQAALVLVCASVSLQAEASDYQVDQSVIASAEGASVGGGFSVTGGLKANSSETLANADFQLIGDFAPLTFNHAPFAMPDILTRPANDDLKIELRQLLSNDFDPDADNLSIQVATASDAGVPIVVSGSWIFYRHISSAADSFTYTIADSNGAISQGRVDIQIGDPNSQFSTQLRIALDGAGAHIQFAGIQNRIYIVQSRDTFNTPWVDRAPATDLGLGRFQFDDSSGGVTRFYRVVYRP